MSGKNQNDAEQNDGQNYDDDDNQDQEEDYDSQDDNSQNNGANDGDADDGDGGDDDGEGDNDGGNNDDEDDDDDGDSNDENEDGPKYIRLRGLPWSATHKEILDFLKDINVVGGTDGIHIATRRWDGVNSGEAYVELKSQQDALAAMKLDNASMGHRYIEVFNASSKVAKEAMRKTSSHGNSYVVKLRGLPFSITEPQVEAFFSGLEIKADREGIVFIMDRRGRTTGGAFVQFESQEDTEQALERNRQKIGHRYIEIFRSSLAELKRYTSDNGRMAPYDLKDRGSNRGGNGSDYGGGNNRSNRGWSNNGGFGIGAKNTLGFNNLPSFGNNGNFGNNNGGGGGGNFGNFGNNGGGGGGMGNFGNFGNNGGGNFGNNGGNFGNNDGGNFGNFGGGNGGNNFGNNSGGGNNGGGGGGFNRFSGNSGNFGNDFGDFDNFGNDRGNNGMGGGGGGKNNNFSNFGDFGDNSGGGFGNNTDGGFGNNMGGNSGGGGGGNFGPIGGGRSDEYYMITMRGLPFTSFENDVYKFFEPIRPLNVSIHYNKQNGRHNGTAEAIFENFDDYQVAMKRHRCKMGARYIELFSNGRKSDKGGNNYSTGGGGIGGGGGNNSIGIGGGGMGGGMFSRRI